ncbi:helix-turn-helix transcriptional regulator [Desulfoscipio geothermicus]|uniref:Helix-turn-helix n=1 Tax=Desulfoscipio geothermicus DSM 3669 TaxID=1121426 RepID=A0A1I6E4R5_9FIRM|nr:helix-turn-helix transcriptional regulator [Desulfoscipio geothermicus]SFR12627.1 Helix-turn-helix [Desulfoscipio geothermicus DSM 3669]
MSIIPLDLAAKRKYAGLTQKQLCEKIGISEFHLLRAEKGKVNMSFKTAVKCAAIFKDITFYDKESGTKFKLEILNE